MKKPGWFTRDLMAARERALLTSARSLNRLPKITPEQIRLLDRSEELLRALKSARELLELLNRIEGKSA